MKPFDIYKIADTLNEFESSMGVLRVSPVWGREMSAQDYFQYMRPRVEAARRLLLPGELGCALAHLEAYRRIADSGRPGVILEDDIALTADALKKMIDVLTGLPEPDFVNFALYRHVFLKKELAPGLYVADTSEGFWGAAAYFVSPKMAARMKRHHSSWIDLADNWQEIFVGSNAIPYYAPIFQHTGEETRIGNRSSPPQNASIIQALKLRFHRQRMVLFSRLRYMRHVSLARIVARASVKKKKKRTTDHPCTGQRPL